MTARNKLAMLVATCMLFGPMIVAGPTAHAADCDRNVTAPANLQNALDAAGAGATVCLYGTFSTSSTIRPLAQQTIVGGTLRYSGSYDVCVSCDLTDGYSLRAPDVTLRGVEVAGFEGRGVVCGQGSKIAGSYIHDNRKNGIACSAKLLDYGLSITGNLITHNGSSVLVGRSAGGIKLLSLSYPTHALGSGATIDGNTVSDNIGNGIWFDRTSSAGIVSNNVASGNSHYGIRCEKCAGPFLFDGNTVHDNGYAGITIHNSAVVTVTHTTSYSNGGRWAGVWVSFDEKAQKTYPAVMPVTAGYHVQSVIIDGAGATDGIRGCTYFGVSCR